MTLPRLDVDFVTAALRARLRAAAPLGTFSYPVEVRDGRVIVAIPVMP